METTQYNRKNIGNNIYNASKHSSHSQKTVYNSWKLNSKEVLFINKGTLGKAGQVERQVTR